MAYLFKNIPALSRLYATSAAAYRTAERTGTPFTPKDCNGHPATERDVFSIIDTALASPWPAFHLTLPVEDVPEPFVNPAAKDPAIFRWAAEVGRYEAGLAEDKMYDFFQDELRTGCSVYDECIDERIDVAHQSMEQSYWSRSATSSSSSLRDACLPTTLPQRSTPFSTDRQLAEDYAVPPFFFDISALIGTSVTISEDIWDAAEDHSTDSGSSGSELHHPRPVRGWVPSWVLGKAKGMERLRAQAPAPLNMVAVEEAREFERPAWIADDDFIYMADANYGAGSAWSAREELTPPDAPVIGCIPLPEVEDSPTPALANPLETSAHPTLPPIWSPDRRLYPITPRRQGLLDLLKSGST